MMMTTGLILSAISMLAIRWALKEYRRDSYQAGRIGKALRLWLRSGL